MKPDLLAKTIETWQPLSPVQLTEEDAAEIVTSMKGFLGILREWANADQAGDSQVDTPDSRPMAAKPSL